MVRHLGILFFGLIWLWVSPGWAGPLADRVAAFPQWHSKPPVQVAVGDLYYPKWFEGTWTVMSTLTDRVAPLAPEIVTPGFEGNEAYLHRPLQFQVRFVAALPLPTRTVPTLVERRAGGLIVADRAFNGFNIARAYFQSETENPIQRVEVAPDQPNRQITFLRGERQLISTITGRAIEEPMPDQFVTSEVFQQIFRGSPQPYLNQVETTTAYRHLPGSKPTIVADQLTAVYLSPQDALYFKARRTETADKRWSLATLKEHPVALYRYCLEFSSADPEDASSR